MGLPALWLTVAAVVAAAVAAVFIRLAAVQPRQGKAQTVAPLPVVAVVVVVVLVLRAPMLRAVALPETAVMAFPHPLRARASRALVVVEEAVEPPVQEVREVVETAPLMPLPVPREARILAAVVVAARLLMLPVRAVPASSSCLFPRPTPRLSLVV